MIHIQWNANSSSKVLGHPLQDLWNGRTHCREMHHRTNEPDFSFFAKLSEVSIIDSLALTMSRSSPTSAAQEIIVKATLLVILVINKKTSLRTQYWRFNATNKPWQSFRFLDQIAALNPLLSPLAASGNSSVIISSSSDSDISNNVATVYLLEASFLAKSRTVSSSKKSWSNTSMLSSKVPAICICLIESCRLTTFAIFFLRYMLEETPEQMAKMHNLSI